MVLCRVPHLVPRRNEGAEVCGGRKYEAIDIVLLEILYFFLLSKNGAGVLNLADADYIWLSKQTLTLCEASDSVS